MTKTAPHLQSLYLSIAQKVKKTDHSGEISKQAHHVARLLRIDTDSHQHYLSEIGSSHTDTWIAYSFIDYLIDSRILSTPEWNIAHTLKNSAHSRYTQVARNQKIVSQLFSALDTANAYEQEQLQTQKASKTLTYRQLLQRARQQSALHVLPGLLTVDLLDAPRGDINTLKYTLLQYSLIRKLCDDIYDWKEDYENNILTFATSYILRRGDTGVKSLKSRFFYADLQTLTAMVLRICNTTEKNILLAKRSADAKILFTHFIEPLKTNLESARIKNKRDQKTLQYHRNSSATSFT